MKKVPLFDPSWARLRPGPGKQENHGKTGQLCKHAHQTTTRSGKNQRHPDRETEREIDKPDFPPRRLTQHQAQRDPKPHLSQQGEMVLVNKLSVTRPFPQKRQKEPESSML